MEPAKERITGFDSMRFFMVFLVIALHSAMTYMEYAPPWWYVLDDRRSIWFAFLVVFLDSFPMSALFFLSGYFAFPSLNKKGKVLFLKDKLLRIGVPWALGVIFVAPFLALATAVALGYPPPDAGTFVTSYFLGPFYQQGPYWFLGVLFVFMAGLAVAARAGVAAGSQNPRFNPWALLAGLWAVSALTYYLSGRYVKPAVEWLNVGYILYFQPARVVGYAGIFALGCHAWKAGWFTSAGWSPNVFAWGAISAVSSALLLAFKFFISPGRGELYELVSETLTYNMAAVSVTIFLGAFFVRPRRPLSRLAKLGKLAKNFERDSYGIYWLHMIVLMPMLCLLKPLDIPIGVKWALSLPATLVVCSAILRIYRHVCKQLGMEYR
ncbi:MAG: acyltransferase [Synergistaceae bacterium]|nr:acyltransferase [Synergistaceae bacterium]